MSRGLVLMLLVGCAGDVDGGDNNNPDGGGGLSDAQSCYVQLFWDPMPAIASPNIKLRVDAIVDAPGGIFGYNWSVSRDGNTVPFEEALPNFAAIQFPIPEPGVYQVFVNVDAGVACTSGSAPINVEAPGANVQEMRLRVRPPLALNLPPEDRFVQVKGGTDEYSIGSIVVDAGRLATGSIVDGAMQVPAYLKLFPIAARDAYVEHFADDGTFSVRVVSEPHDVLIIPSIEGYAPALVKNWMPGQTTLPIDAGTAVTGVVRDSSGVVIVGAKVQLTIDGVPSTLGTTDASGAFSVLARPVAGAPVVVDVAPPAARGLPRLVATSSALALGQPLLVRYTIATRNVSTATVRRGGAAVPNARVSIVGTTATVGNVSTGGTPVTASGTTRVAVVADAAGKLPSAVAPAAPLFAVTQVSVGDLAVDPFDLTTGVPATIDAPARVPLATELASATQQPLPGGVLDAIPAGPLHLAGAPAQRFVANASGQITGLLPANGTFELRLHDPQGRGSLRRFANVTPSTVQASYSLGVPLKIVGTVTSSETLQPIAGASVQLLCASCTGIDRNRPEGEGATGGNGNFGIVVPDPGTTMN